MVGGQDDIYLGFDPGGDRKFGVAILNGSFVKTGVVSSVHDAMNWAENECQEQKPKAVGIDTLLHWSTCRSGTRPCDKQLREKYSNVKNSIMAPNSLYGSMAVGGMALALTLR